MDFKNSIDYHRLNQAVNPISVTLSDIECLLGQVHMASDISYVLIDLANIFFPILFRKLHEKQFVFMGN